MSFVTKLDYSDNRQIKQFQLTNTKLSGTTEFGVDVNDLGGVNEATVTPTGTLVNITSTFSGNSSTTIFWFGDSRMISAASSLYAITNLTSGDTQTAIGFEGVGPTIVDGNNVYSGYTGSTYDIIVTAITETGVNEWTGETYSSVVTILSGASSDFSGRAIWVDVLGVTRTKRLILADKPDALTGVTTVLTRDEFGDIYEVEFSAVTTDNYISGSTFSASTGDLTLTSVSGNTITTNLDGRYSLTGHTHAVSEVTDFPTNVSYFTNDVGYLTGATSTDNDYVTGSTYDASTGLINFTRLSGGTFNVDIDITSGDTTNWNSTYNNIITGATFTGTVSKTLTLKQRDGNTITADFTDNSGGGAGETITGATFDTGTGELALFTNSGNTITSNLDGRYSLTGHTHPQYLTGYTDTNIFVSGGTFNSELLQFTNTSGGTFSIDLSNTYSLTGHTHVGLSDDYLTGHTFNTSTGLFESTLQSGGTVSVNLDGRYALTGHTHDLSGLTNTGHTHTVSEISNFPTNVSYFTNDVGYLTGYTDTNIFVSGGTFNSEILQFTNTSGGTFNIDLSNTYSLTGHTHNFSGLTNTGHTHTVSEISNFPTNVSYFTNDVGYITGYTDTNDYVTGGTFNITNGNLTLSRLSGGTIVTNLDNRYSLTGHTHVGLSDDYVTGATFASGTTGILTLTRVSGGTVTVDLDGRYGDVFKVGTPVNNQVGVWTGNGTLEGDTALTFDTSVNQLTIGSGTTAFGWLNIGHGTGGQATIDLQTAGSGAVSKWRISPTFNGTGDFDITADSTSAFKIDQNTLAAYSPQTTVADIDTVGAKALITKEYLTTNYTPTSGGTVNTNDYITGASFASGTTGILTLTRLSGGTVTVDLDGRYLEAHPAVSAAASSNNSGRTYIQDILLDTFGHITGITTSTEIVVNTNDYVTGHTFNTSTGLFTSTRQSGSTVSVNLDGRYVYASATTENLYTTDGTIPSGVTRNVIFGDAGSSVTFSGTGQSSYFSESYTDITANYWSLSSFDGTGGNINSSDGGSLELIGPNGMQIRPGSGGIFPNNTVGQVLTAIGANGNVDWADAQNDYITGGTFNVSTGDLTLTRVSGGTVITNLDNRYSLTGHTHSEFTNFGNYLPLSGGTLTGPVTGTTFNVSNALLSYQENLDVDISTEVVATISKLVYTAAFFDYVVINGANVRAGTVMAAHDGTSVVYTDTSTSDLGNTSGVSFNVDISGNNLRLNATVTSNNWIIKTLIRGI